MPTIGSYTSVPNGRFRVMRSFITHFRVRQNSDNYPVSLVGDQLIWPSAAFPNINQYATILHDWWAWSSNAYTLDYLITEYYYTVSPSPTPIPNAGLILRYVWDPVLNAMILEIEKESANTEQLFSLGGAGGSYWLNPVPA